MTNEQAKTEWKKLMGPIASGHGTRKMVSAFDRLTSQMLHQKVISFDEFLATQAVIVVAKKAAETAHVAGLEGCFLHG